MSDRLIGRLTVSSNVSATLIDKTVTHNGLYEAYDDNADGYKTVDVDIPLMAQKNISQNGTYVATDEDVDGYEKVVVDVPPNVGTKTITENGTYNASSDNLDGFSQVVVNVSGADPSQYNYTWFSNPEKTLVVRVTNATGFFKIWFEGIVIDDKSTGQFRWKVPSVLNPYALQKNTVATQAVIYSPTLGDDLGGKAGFEYLNGEMYVYLNITGHASQKLSGTIKKALMYSTDTGNAGSHLDDWSEPTFDPING